MPLAELLDALDYNQFPQYYLRTDTQHTADIAPLFRTAKQAGVDGIYLFRSSPKDENILPMRPAVYVAETQTPEQAREIHCHLWNLGQAPFLIVVLPDQIRVYTGFDYSWQSEREGLLEDDVSLDRDNIRDQLADFCAESINTGLLWQKRANALTPDRRVDKRLLKNLSELSHLLRTKEGLDPQVAHALIGKYIYIRYLRDRNILSDEWLKQHNVDIDRILGRHATLEGLRTLVEILEEWLNGNIFPLNLKENTPLTDRYVSQVASVFKGDQPLSEDLWQLSLDLQVYDFKYIPIETLSTIYEQFLHAEDKGEQIGAYYTPEYLADYLIAEINAIKPLKQGMKILDPSCGSGVFLVLAYRRLIEGRLAELAKEKLPLEELLTLLDNLYGIERVPDACYVAEFSLILTLLHYADTTELLNSSSQFKFPSLHNTHIFQYDFFDDSLPIWKLKFDWIVGNPPWIQADSQKEKFAQDWITQNRKERPVGKQNIAEAFSWRVTDLLEQNGCAGLLLPATSLYNLGSKKYRQHFFQNCEIIRISNFSNLRRELFEGRAIAPVVTIIYHQALEDHEKPFIEHFGPFFINQTPSVNGKLWTITINENEFQDVSPYEAEHGDAATWKFALWGTHRDKHAIARLRRLFPLTLGQLYEQNKKNGWYLHEGSQLRKGSDEHLGGLEPVPHLEAKKRLNTISMNKSERLFSIPVYALEDIPKEECYIRIQGGRKGLLVSEAPHIVMSASWKYVIYSDVYFVIRPRQIGLSAPRQYADYLRALSVFLSSSLVRYYLFFQTSSFGIERDRITLNDIKTIPIPNLTMKQIEELNSLQEELVQAEVLSSSLDLQTKLDKRVAEILKFPEDISFLASEFTQTRLSLIEGTKIWRAASVPNKEDLLAYAQELVAELDDFIHSAGGRHKVTIIPSKELIVCNVELTEAEAAIPIVVEEENSTKLRRLTEIRDRLNQRFSQWIYIQRGLRVFDGPEVRIYKAPRLIDWTRTQALNDASDIIGEVLYIAEGN